MSLFLEISSIEDETTTRLSPSLTDYPYLSRMEISATYE